MSKTFTKADVAAHKDEKEGGMYIIVEDGVYDISSGSSPLLSSRKNDADALSADFLDEHPGGAKILRRMAGKDASKQFWKYHGKAVLDKYGGKLRVGTVKETAKL